jgi:hypothetical protein
MRKITYITSLLTCIVLTPAMAQIYVPMESSKPGQRTITDPRVPQDNSASGNLYDKPIVAPQAPKTSTDVGADDFERNRQAELESKQAELKKQAEEDKEAAQEMLDDVEDEVRSAGEAADADAPSMDQILSEDDIMDIVSENPDGKQLEGSPNVRIKDMDDVTIIRD